MNETFLNRLSLGKTAPEPRELRCANCGEPLPMLGEEPVLTCMSCGQGHRSLAPPPPAPEIVEAPLGRGDRAAVLWGTRWWAAHVVEVMPNGGWRVHYEGWAPSFDEVVEKNRIRPIDYDPGPSIIPPPPPEQPIKVKRGSMLSAVGIVLVFAAGAGFLLSWALGAQVFNPDAEPQKISQAKLAPIFDRMPGSAVGADARLTAGQSVYVKWGGGWYRGTILEAQTANSILIRYDGWEDSYNEVVPRDRLRSLK